MTRLPADAGVIQLADFRTQVLPHTPREKLPEDGGRNPEFIISGLHAAALIHYRLPFRRKQSIQLKSAPKKSNRLFVNGH
jgi:hypothetical protein